MESQATEEGCSPLLKGRAERFGNGGVGLLIGTDLAESAAVRRLARRSRGLAIAAVAVLLVLFSAAGFAGAKMWDGRETKLMPLEMAIDVAVQSERADLRESGLGQIMGIASRSTRALLELSHDPALGESAKIYLSQLRKLLPEPASLEVALLSAGNGALPAAERERFLREIDRHVRAAVIALGVMARDAELSSAATELLSHLEKLVDRAIAESR